MFLYYACGHLFQKECGIFSLLLQLLSYQSGAALKMVCLLLKKYPNGIQPGVIAIRFSSEIHYPRIPSKSTACVTNRMSVRKSLSKTILSFS